MRALRILLIIGVVLTGLLVAVDRFAVGYAEDKLAARVHFSQGLAGSTDVDIRGFPFLTQVVGYELDQVDAHLRGIEADTAGRRVRITSIDASFHDVKLSADYNGGTAARADGEAFLSYADLTAASQTGVTVAYGGAPGKVKVTASVEILGRTFSRSVTSTVSLVEGNVVRVRAEHVPGEGFPGLEELIRKKTDFDRPVDALPKGLDLTSVTSDGKGVRAVLKGTAVNLGAR
ncbi:DUF2993 domain-containing protein [Streptomyces sp. NPDC101132]|uniref:LmeA family phospholipid-binding protein n=1 Tax=Streptomyces sp. NPDC101132 TaxID=3366110 RepID=UPI0037FC9CD2